MNSDTSNPISLPLVPTETPARAPTGGAWAVVRSLLLRGYRLAVIVGIVWMVHEHHVRLKIDGDAPVRVEEVLPFFPNATALVPDESEKQGLFVVDAGGKRLGYVVRTSPISDKNIGYQGPTDTMIALTPEMKVLGIKVRRSHDTREHVRDIEADEYFMKLWTAKTWDEVAGVSPAEAGVEGVSGASLTSLAIANSIYQRFAYSTDLAKKPRAAPALRFRGHDWGLLAVIVVAGVFSFTHLRSHPWVRRGFQAVLIGYVGLYNGQLLAQSLFSGWSVNGLPWKLAPGLVLLGAAALIVPWTSRRAIYCSHICPHGAAQEWVGRLNRRKLRLHKGVDAGLRWLPFLLIAAVLAVVMLNLNAPSSPEARRVRNGETSHIDLAGFEPFDAYLVPKSAVNAAEPKDAKGNPNSWAVAAAPSWKYLGRAAGAATVIIALVGLAAALFVPMAYCKYGCPTGMLLNFVRSHGRADRLGRRDLAAGLLVLLVFACWHYHWYDLVRPIFNA